MIRGHRDARELRFSKGGVAEESAEYSTEGSRVTRYNCMRDATPGASPLFRELS